MARRMQFASRLMLLSVAGLIGCAGALGLSRQDGHPEPEARAAHQALRHKRKKPVDAPDDPTIIRTQSYIQLGGLDDFEYFYTQGNTVPPQSLPTSVTGRHRTRGTVTVQLIDKGKNSCVTAGDVPLYEVLVPTSDGEVFNPCALEKAPRDPNESCEQKLNGGLDRKAVAVPGAWNAESGQYYESTPDGKKVFTLACMTGIVAKCVNWGYRPWAVHEGTPLADYYAACLHAARAGYAASAEDSSGDSYTCNGTEIDVYDRLGIQTPSADSQTPLGLDPKAPWGKLEAAWGKDGPICISAPRYPACSNDPAVTAVGPCDEAALLWDSRATWPDKPQWPAKVLLVTRSTNNNATPGGACPKNAEGCGPLTLHGDSPWASEARGRR